MISRQKLNSAFKKKYLGKMIYQTGDRFGNIQVIEDGMIRSLHFDAIEKQSAMDIERPEALVLSYTQFMMAGFLFNNDVNRLLCIGLGGGSIPRYLAYHMESCLVDVVEIRKEVFRVAQKFFLLPIDGRFRYFEGDGAHYVRKSETCRYDMILVDAYDQKGVAASVAESSFYERCASILNTNGVFCINLWSHPSDVYRNAMDEMMRCFGKRTVEIPVRDRTNRIVLGLDRDVNKQMLQSISRRALSLEQSMELPFPRMLTHIVQSNPALFK